MVHGTLYRDATFLFISLAFDDPAPLLPDCIIITASHHHYTVSNGPMPTRISLGRAYGLVSFLPRLDVSSSRPQLENLWWRSAETVKGESINDIEVNLTDFFSSVIPGRKIMCDMKNSVGVNIVLAMVACHQHHGRYFS